jgi:hypothetical protein
MPLEYCFNISVSKVIFFPINDFLNNKKTPNDEWKSGIENKTQDEDNEQKKFSNIIFLSSPDVSKFCSRTISCFEETTLTLIYFHI